MKIESAFKKRNINLLHVKSREEAKALIMKIIPIGSTVGFSGSRTLEQVGILDELRKGGYVFLDRAKAKTSEEIKELMHKCLNADFYLAGANAITMDGKIVSKDGRGNRVSAMIYGPNKVIVVVGKNKVTENVEAALKRIETIAAPLNAKRLKLETPCTEIGHCIDCSHTQRICRATAIIEGQYDPERITVILADEELGY
jgi:hypothetical protein